MVELTQSHTADYIGSQLLNTLTEWNVHKNNVAAVVTDNGANMVKAIYDQFGRENHIPCFAHTINLVVENSISNSEEFKQLLHKVREVVKYFKRSTSASDELRKLQINEGKINL